LPVSYLWPLATGPTILCRTCNGNKSDQWPKAYYKNEGKLRVLSTLTGVPYATLAGDAVFNAEQVARISGDPDSVITRWVKYPARLTNLQTRVLDATGEDIFANASQQARKAIGLE